MSLFGWALVFIGLALVAIAVMALLALRLWRRIKVVGREAAAAADRFSGITQTPPRRGAHVGL
jgi:hypothetical protein